MGNDSTVVLSDEPLFQTHLTDKEIAALTGIGIRSVKDYRQRRGMPFGKRHPFECQTYNGKTMRVAHNLTPVDDMRAWFMATGRTKALAALDKLIADKAASPIDGE